MTPQVCCIWSAYGRFQMTANPEYASPSAETNPATILASRVGVMPFRFVDLLPVI